MEKEKLTTHQSSKGGATSILMICIIMLYIFIGGCKDKSEKAINSIKSNLPHGTPLIEVATYLKKANYEYSYDKKTKCFTAILRNVSKKALTSADIELVIKMDDNDKLRDLDAKVVHTGP